VDEIGFIAAGDSHVGDHHATRAMRRERGLDIIVVCRGERIIAPLAVLGVACMMPGDGWEC
jgi:hypothetical protein